METSYTFFVAGMHCSSCVLLTEAEMKAVPGVRAARTNLAQAKIEVTGEFGDAAPGDVMTRLSVSLEKHGYTLSLTPAYRVPLRRWHEFSSAIPFAVLFLVVYVLLQKTGLVNLIPGGEPSYGTVFVIGVIASLSTCMAVVGGIVLTLSSAYAKSGETILPLTMFHGARILGFLVLGGVLGAVGSAITLNDTVLLVVNLAVACAMIVVGIDLLDVIAWPKRFTFRMPSIVGRHAMMTTRIKHVFAPMMIGVATFFLPCGFTQSMQLYALSTGSFVSGAVTMSVFALGTFPVLALISFGVSHIERLQKSGVFLKAAGIVVCAFAALNILNALVIAGILNPIFFF
jgi:sulfite exporter TauE/SafE/copper chaperone CopZ